MLRRVENGPKMGNDDMTRARAGESTGYRGGR
jgi:hypothetical protein